jgi:hypothetical protein
MVAQSPWQKNLPDAQTHVEEARDSPSSGEKGWPQIQQGIAL